MKLSRTPDAFSLIEMLLAFAILSLAIVPVLGLFSGAARQAKTTSDHTFALTLAQKVTEDLRTAEWENSHLTKTVEMLPVPGRSIIDGEAREFEVIEDATAPFGVIQPGVDPGIGPGFAALYRQAKSFKISVGSMPSASLTTGAAMDVVVAVEWNDTNGVARNLSVPVVVGACVGADSFAPPDRELADERIARVLYPSEAGTLSTIIAGRGGDLGVVRDLGDIVVNVIAITSTAEENRTRLAELREAIAAATTDAARARAQITLARAAEDRAAASFEAMRCSAPAARRMQIGFDIARLGTPPPPYPIWFAPVRMMGSLNNVFVSNLVQARDAYLLAYDAPLGEALPARMRSRIGIKLIELTKLKILSEGPPDTAPLLAFLEAFRAHHEGRNVNLERFAEVEITQAANAEVLKDSYPVPARLEALNLFKEAYQPAVTNVTGSPP